MKTEFNHVKIQAFFVISLSQLHFCDFFYRNEWFVFTWCGYDSNTKSHTAHYL